MAAGVRDMRYVHQLHWIASTAVPSVDTSSDVIKVSTSVLNTHNY